MAENIRVGIVGCGNIAGPYVQNLTGYPETELVGVTDVDATRAQALAAKVGCRAYGSLEELLASDVDLVVNLTIHHAHHQVTRACLEAGKHVYSEKPLALTPAEARELVALARERELRLGCSPFTFLGAAQQAAWQLVRDGTLGTVRVAYAEVNWGRIESWHPNPGPFYEVGALWDVGVYPLTLLTAFFGPARRVLAAGRVLHADRRTKTGEAFHIETPDFVTATLELESGPLVRLTTNFYVHQQGTRQSGVELHGDLGSLHLSSWQEPDATLSFAPFGQPLERVSVLAERMEWGRGVREMAQAMTAGRPHRATGEQAAHVVDILAATAESIRTGALVDVGSSFPPPAPLEPPLEANA